MLNPAHVQALEARKISGTLATAMGLYSAKRCDDGSIVPYDTGKILCFPYVEGFDEVNTKFRWTQDGKKRFQQRPDSPKTFFNANVLLDDDMMLRLETGSESLIITEGEPDCLSAIECGFDATVSVPDGAPPARDKNGNLIEVPEDSRDLDPENDIKYAYLTRHIDRLAKVKQFVIATDDDEPGHRLAKELVRRLGPARCFRVIYPDDKCVPDPETGELRRAKDLNEVHIYLGEARVREIVETAQPWPIKGIFRFSEYPDVGEPVTFVTGVSPDLDEVMRLYPGAFVVATGVPGMGKSTLIKQICVNMGKLHGWKTVMFPGEEPIKPYLWNSLRTCYIGKHRRTWSAEEREAADSFIDDHFRIITSDPRSDEEEIDVDYIIEKAEQAVFRDGINLLVVDPWNELEHKRDKHWSLTEYVGDSIRKFKRFAKGFNCCVVIVAHPKKVDGQPGLYDISDSAHWANKADIGLVVHSDEPMGTRRDAIVSKVRFSAAGRKARVPMEFDRETELYVPAEQEEPIAA
ncbi:MAG: toprim domain-containing protein [Rhizobiaceae bacterium]|nr:toprim domain-containing protein [Rhizobiaceae bacterium]MCC0000878.1 toprim domain-containing protein [Methylobacteriaceae bacterium]